MGGAHILEISSPRVYCSVSTTQGEYVGASETCKEAIWHSRLTYVIGIPELLPELFRDNQSAVNLVYGILD